jgi:flagellar basal body-associated protein FliL
MRQPHFFDEINYEAIRGLAFLMQAPVLFHHDTQGGTGMNIPQWNSFSKTERILLFSALLLLLFFIVLPLFVNPTDRQAPLASEPGTVPVKIGTVRASYPQKPKRIVVADIAITLENSDTGFSDEVTSKKTRLKSIAAEYIQANAGRGTATELQPTLAAGLRDTFNAMLYLGRVDSVVFTRFEVLE